MQNAAIIGVVAVLAVGGIWYLSSTGSETSTRDTDPLYQTNEANDARNDSMAREESMESEVEMEVEPVQPDIVETAAATESLSTLATAVTEAELVATLQGDGPFTVFAPTNDAFAALPTDTLESLLDPANQADLQSVLTYHVVPGEVMAADLTDGMTVETVNGETLTFAVSEAGVTINGNASVTMADIETSNGVVHVIDGVLLPSAAE